jgi:Mn2+/Fe2+ NRAMP family transporter
MNDTPQAGSCRSSSTLSGILLTLGPGVLFACAAVGGSHLVWSTRAGAEFGWSLVWLILLVNFLKFPFFLYGQRYAAATGESLLEGYNRSGKVFIIIFLVLNILTATINTAGVAMITAAMLEGFGFASIGMVKLTIIILGFSTVVLLVGHYAILDKLSKAVMIVLSACTLAAVVLALDRGQVAPVEGFVSPSPWTLATLPFLVSLLGWMPAPVDLAAWSSLWVFSRRQETGHVATVKEVSYDFYINYVLTAVLAVAFLALGALVMHGSGQSFSPSGTGFSFQLVSLYSSVIGEWSRWLILTCAFLTMFGTTLTCLDGYPRALAASSQIIRAQNVRSFRSLHQFWIIMIAASSVVVVLYMVKSLMHLLVFATAASFLTSPVLAWINMKVMNGPNVPERYRPGLFLRVVSWTGLVSLSLMGLGYIYVLLFL